jgi:hypothetical protein
MLSHFAAQGYHCSKTTNPADFALDLITVDLQHESKEAVSRAKVRKLIESWTSDMFPAARTGSIATPAELGSLAREPASFASAFPILLRRATKNFFRQPDLLAARIGQVVGLGVVLALFFAPLKNDYFAIQNRLGFLVEIAPLYFVGMLNNIAIYPIERDVFYRDYDDRVYGVSAFFLTYTVIEVPFEIITTLIFAVLTVLACGLERSAKIFFIIVFNSFCIVSCGESLGIAFNTLFTHTGFSVNCMSVFLSVAQIMGKFGFFYYRKANANRLHRWCNVPKHPLVPPGIQPPLSYQICHGQHGTVYNSLTALYLRRMAKVAKW